MKRPHRLLAVVDPVEQGEGGDGADDEGGVRHRPRHPMPRADCHECSGEDVAWCAEPPFQNKNHVK